MAVSDLSGCAMAYGSMLSPETRTIRTYEEAGEAGLENRSVIGRQPGPGACGQPAWRPSPTTSRTQTLSSRTSGPQVFGDGWASENGAARGAAMRPHSVHGWLPSLRAKRTPTL